MKHQKTILRLTYTARLLPHERHHTTNRQQTDLDRCIRDFLSLHLHHMRQSTGKRDEVAENKVKEKECSNSYHEIQGTA